MHLVHSQCCATTMSLLLQNFLSPQNTPYLIPPFPHSLATTNLLSVSTNLGVSHKKSHLICDLFVQLISVIIVFLRFIQIVKCISISFIFKFEKYSIAWIYNSFIHSLIVQHLVCFHLSATNAHEQDLFEYLFSVLWSVYLGVKLMGHMIIPGLTF